MVQPSYCQMDQEMGVVGALAPKMRPAVYFACRAVCKRMQYIYRCLLPWKVNEIGSPEYDEILN